MAGDFYLHPHGHHADRVQRVQVPLVGGHAGLDDGRQHLGALYRGHRLSLLQR